MLNIKLVNNSLWGVLMIDSNKFNNMTQDERAQLLRDELKWYGLMKFWIGCCAGTSVTALILILCSKFL